MNRIIKKITDDKLPNLIFIIEELSDLFSVYDEINPHIIKLLKYGKNVGIHLIIMHHLSVLFLKSMFNLISLLK